MSEDDRHGVPVAVVFLLGLLAGCRAPATTICADDVGPVRPKSVASASTSTLPVDLPTSDEVFTATILNVQLDDKGGIRANAKAVTLTELTAVAKELVGKQPGVRAVIVADAAVRYGAIVSTMDALRMGGLSKISFGIAR